jgi:predicted NBD/HSP70 family sugar kinase
MKRTIGVLAAEHIAAGLVENNQIVGPVRIFPETDHESDALDKMPADEILHRITQLIEMVGRGEEIEAIGVGFPGIIRDGVVEESPNLSQTKGQDLGVALAFLVGQQSISAPVRIFNDADVMAAGIAARHGQLDKLIRVWTLGTGIGFGRYPQAEGVWEGGHTVVTLDPRENYCACGGIGHLEGIMGHRAMRLRFLDLEPEEVFAEAAAGDARCAAFVMRWHRALAAATATSIHMDGPGKFFISGPNARFVELGVLHRLIYGMVKISPLQGSSLEIVETGDETAIIGAAVNAARAAAALESPLSSGHAS